MVLKRSFYEEETHSVTTRKHPRQVEYNNELVSFSDFVRTEVGSPRFHVKGESGLTENASEIDPIIARKDVEDNVPGRSLISSSNIGFNEEAYESYSSEYFSPSPQHPCRAITHHEDMYSFLLRYPPRKEILIGPDHQADIPQWSPHEYKLKTKFSGTPGSVLDEDRLIGTCVIPMPDLESVNELENLNEDECLCLDHGSTRRVRQHIAEARDGLERNLGKERFEELGFGVMGEKVAMEWSEEEEELFYEVVFSNPMSRGRNFWNCLSSVFPCRTKQEIVSYYFNVFMVRRRGEQNRCKSKGIYDSDDNELESCSLTPNYNRRRIDGEEVQDESSTSGEMGVPLQRGREESDAHWSFRYNGLSYGSYEDDDDLEDCNVKLWDMDYTECPKIDVDLLSTCSMIEEVFGGASLKYKARDEKSQI